MAMAQPIAQPTGQPGMAPIAQPMAMGGAPMGQPMGMVAPMPVGWQPNGQQMGGFQVGECVIIGEDEKAWIVKVLGGGRYAVDYRDGETSYEELEEGDMRRPGMSRFNVGECVIIGDDEKAWIVKVLGDGRYAVDYRDG